MFYFLIFLSIGLIILGIILNRDKLEAPSRKQEPTGMTYSELERFHILEKRVEELERLFSIESDLDQEEELRLIEKYESQGYSVDEIGKLLDMSKGEVLLLKKLREDY